MNNCSLSITLQQFFAAIRYNQPVSKISIQAFPVIPLSQSKYYFG